MRMNISRFVHTCAVLLLLFAMADPAQAQQRGFALNALDLSERGSEWFSADSLDLRGHVRPAVGIVGEWAYRPLTARSAGDDYIRSIVRHQFVLHPGASLVLFDRVRLGLDIPVQAYADGQPATVGGVTVQPPVESASLGDIRLSADARLFGSHGELITGALGVAVALPTGDEASFAGDGQVRITPRFMLAGEIGKFVWAGRIGVTIRPNEHEFADTNTGTYLGYALAAGVRVLERRLVIGPELFARTSLTDDQFFKKRTTPTELMLGAHYKAVNQLRLGAGIGFGLTSGYGAPSHRAILSVEWVPELAAEPEPSSDRDGDGIEDARDACPDEPGAPDAQPCKNGCPPPPPDRDFDGIPDVVDACPNIPGVANSVDPNANGCPPAPPSPPDADGDGIADAEDACPREAGVASADRTRHGCPAAKDTDDDGILDSADACPNDVGAADPDPKRNGCPKAFLQGSQIKILDQVKFRTNQAEILPGKDSEEVLVAVHAVISAHPELQTIRIEGHTDNTGAPARNRELSQQRAQAVRNWLVKHGVAASRLRAEGYGPDRPIESNDTPEGRHNNRRVEFQIDASTPEQ